VIDEDIKKDLKIFPVKWIDEVFDIALEKTLAIQNVVTEEVDVVDKPAVEVDSNPAAHH